MPDNQALAAFKQGFRGDLVGPADANYDDARKLYNGMNSSSPEIHQVLLALAAGTHDSAA